MLLGSKSKLERYKRHESWFLVNTWISIVLRVSGTYVGVC